MKRNQTGRKYRSSATLRQNQILLSNLHPTKQVDLKKLCRRIAVVIANEALSRCRLDFVFTNNACISRLSGKFRGSFHSTDVLSFYYGDGVADSPYGEIVVSLDVACDQANKRNISLLDEVTLYCTHGVIHLTGQDDEDLESWKIMKQREFSNLMSVL